MRIMCQKNEENRRSSDNKSVEQPSETKMGETSEEGAYIDRFIADTKEHLGLDKE